MKCTSVNHKMGAKNSDVQARLGLKAQGWARLLRDQACLILSPGPQP